MQKSKSTIFEQVRNEKPFINHFSHAKMLYHNLCLIGPLNTWLAWVLTFYYNLLNLQSHIGLFIESHANNFRFTHQLGICFSPGDPWGAPYNQILPVESHGYQCQLPGSIMQHNKTILSPYTISKYLNRSYWNTVCMCYLNVGA